MPMQWNLAFWTWTLLSFTLPYILTHRDVNRTRFSQVPKKFPVPLKKNPERETFREISHNPSQQSSVELKSINSAQVDGCRAWRVESSKATHFHHNTGWRLLNDVTLYVRKTYQQTTRCHECRQLDTVVTFFDPIICPSTVPTPCELSIKRSAQWVSSLFIVMTGDRVKLLPHQHDILANARSSARGPGK